MGIMDAFEKEDRAEVKVTTLYQMLREAAKTELIMNAVNCNVPHRFIRELVTGEKEETPEMVIPIKAIGAFVRDAKARIIEQDEEEKSE